MPTIGQVLQGLLTQAERDEARLVRELEDIRLEIRGLKLAIRRATGSDAVETPPSRDMVEESWQPQTPADVSPPPATPETPTPTVPQMAPAGGQNWTELAASVLAEATEPLGGPEVLDRLSAQGIEVSSDQVRGALAYLKRKNRAYLRKRGQWVLFGSPADRALQQDESFRDVTDAPETTETSVAAEVSGDERFEGGEAETPVTAPVHV